jgi:hypothetical protein
MGGVHTLRVRRGGELDAPKRKTFTTARDAVGSEEPIAMGGW